MWIPVRDVGAASALVLLVHQGMAREECCKRTQMDMMAEVPEYGRAAPSPVVPKRLLPKTFDWSNVAGRSYLVPSWNQHIPVYCGSCYAHGALAMVQDRIKVAKRGAPPDVTLARQSFINCGPSYGFGNGCGGGSPTDVFNFMHVMGLPDETCNNYAAMNSEKGCDAEAMCMNCMPSDEGVGECWPVERHTRYYVKEWGTVSGEEAMMSEIFSRGPVVCGFVSDDLFEYEYGGGVHTARAAANQSDINHDVEVTGWGVTPEGLEFWQVRNSWGTYWGEGGFFKIQRGVNLNYFESQCFFALTDWADENLINDGELTGSMYGLVEKDERAAAEAISFRESLRALDWSAIELPPALAAVEDGEAVEPSSPSSSLSWQSPGDESEQLRARGHGDGHGKEWVFHANFVSGLGVGAFLGAAAVVAVLWVHQLARRGSRGCGSGAERGERGGILDGLPARRSRNGYEYILDTGTAGASASR